MVPAIITIVGVTLARTAIGVTIFTTSLILVNEFERKMTAYRKAKESVSQTKRKVGRPKKVKP